MPDRLNNGMNTIAKIEIHVKNKTFHVTYGDGTRVEIVVPLDRLRILQDAAEFL